MQDIADTYYPKYLPAFATSETSIYPLEKMLAAFNILLYLQTIKSSVHLLRFLHLSLFLSLPRQN